MRWSVAHQSFALLFCEGFYVIQYLNPTREQQLARLRECQDAWVQRDKNSFSTRGTGSAPAPRPLLDYTLPVYWYTP